MGAKESRRALAARRRRVRIHHTWGGSVATGAISARAAFATVRRRLRLAASQRLADATATGGPKLVHGQTTIGVLVQFFQGNVGVIHLLGIDGAITVGVKRVEEGMHERTPGAGSPSIRGAFWPIGTFWPLPAVRPLRLIWTIRAVRAIPAVRAVGPIGPFAAVLRSLAPAGSSFGTGGTDFFASESAIAIAVELEQSAAGVGNLVGVNDAIPVGIESSHHRMAGWTPCRSFAGLPLGPVGPVRPWAALRLGKCGGGLESKSEESDPEGGSFHIFGILGMVPARRRFLREDG